MEWSIKLIHHSLRHNRGVSFVPDVIEQDRELVATDARHNARPGATHDVSGVAYTRPQTSGYTHQQLVTGRMPHAVVDQLKPIEIQKKHSEKATRLASFIER